MRQTSPRIIQISFFRSFTEWATISRMFWQSTATMFRNMSLRPGRRIHSISDPTGAGKFVRRRPGQPRIGHDRKGIETPQAELNYEFRMSNYEWKQLTVNRESILPSGPKLRDSDCFAIRKAELTPYPLIACLRSSQLACFRMRGL